MNSQLMKMIVWLSLVTAAHAQQADPQRVDASDLDDDAKSLLADRAAASQTGASQAEIDAALARYAREPSVAEVVREALLAAPARRAQALANRARVAAVLPRLGIRARRGHTVDLSSPQSLAADALHVRSNNDLTLEASLSFELDRIVFRREEVTLLRLDEVERQGHERLVREVIALYFERRRLQLERDLGRNPKPAASVRIVEIEALLDSFTNGAFQRMIGASRWTTGASTAASTSRSSPKSK